MSAATKQATVRVDQPKVSLRAITPLIWRRLRVTSDTTIAQLYAVLQIAMGWEDLHLHQFRMHGKAYDIYRDGGMSFADDPHQVILADFRLRKSERFVYDYDMGDFWPHLVREGSPAPCAGEPRRGDTSLFYVPFLWNTAPSANRRPAGRRWATRGGGSRSDTRPRCRRSSATSRGLMCRTAARW